VPTDRRGHRRRCRPVTESRRVAPDAGGLANREQHRGGVRRGRPVSSGGQPEIRCVTLPLLDGYDSGSVVLLGRWCMSTFL
jgi:hypothetical protein